MSEKIVQLNEEIIKGQLKELVRGSVEETLNELLEKEAESLTQAARYERSEARQGYRSGHYDRSLTTTSGDVTLHVPRLKGVSFETAIIERYRRRESSVEEALIEMYLAGVSVRRVEDITEALWGSKVSPTTISELNKKAYVHIEDWRNRPLQGGRYPYVYVDGIYLRRNWGGEYENVAVLVAIAVNEDGFREVLGAAEGMKEDKASWVSFFQWLRGRGLDGVKLIVGDKCMGMLEAVGEVFPDAKYQRCTVHFYRNVFSVVPKSKVKIMVKMLKAIHAQESKKASREKAKAVVAELRAMKLKEAAKKVEDGIEETLTYYDFPSEHWTRIRTNNVIELAAVVEDPPLRQLLAVCQYRRPGGKQIRHVQGIAVRDGCAGGRIGQHGCAELGRQVRLRLRLGRLLPGRQAHQLAVLYVQVAVARTVPGRLLQLRRYGKPPLQPALRPVALALQAMAAVLPVLNFDDGQHTIPS